jgi:hypothetical protein
MAPVVSDGSILKENERETIRKILAEVGEPKTGSPSSRHFLNPPVPDQGVWPVGRCKHCASKRIRCISCLPGPRILRE